MVAITASPDVNCGVTTSNMLQMWPRGQDIANIAQLHLNLQELQNGLFTALAAVTRAVAVCWQMFYFSTFVPGPLGDI